jgi:hypothetical protein
MALVGDFNARPTAAEMTPISSRFLDAWLEAGAPTTENPNGAIAAYEGPSVPGRREPLVIDGRSASVPALAPGPTPTALRANAPNRLRLGRDPISQIDNRNRG